MTEPAIWQRGGFPDSLRPASPSAKKVLRSVKWQGFLVMGPAEKVRSPDQLRLWWALADKAFENQSRWAAKGDFVAATKYALGRFHLVPVKGGEIVVLDSIALGNMSHEDFCAFMDATKKLYARALNVTVEDLREEA